MKVNVGVTHSSKAKALAKMVVRKTAFLRMRVLYSARSMVRLENSNCDHPIESGETCW